MIFEAAMAQPGDFMSRKQASAYLTKIGCPVSVKTLANMAANNNAGGGPSFLKIRRVKGHRVSYPKADLDAWAYQHTTRVS